MNGFEEELEQAIEEESNIVQKRVQPPPLEQQPSKRQKNSTGPGQSDIEWDEYRNFALMAQGLANADNSPPLFIPGLQAFRKQQSLFTCLALQRAQIRPKLSHVSTSHTMTIDHFRLLQMVCDLSCSM